MRRLLLIIPFLVPIACGSARKQLARAETYEQHGLLNEAHGAYAELYTRRPKEALALVGMKRTAQALLDRKQELAAEAYRTGDIRSGDRYRDEAQAYKRLMESKGLLLELNPLLESQRATAMRSEADRLCGEAASAYATERFAEADELCGQALRLWPDHRDAAHLQRLARTEPLYREAVIAMDKGLWREAHKKLEQAIAIDPAHKDALAKRSECLAKASYTVACIMLGDRDARLEVMSGATATEISAQFLARIKQAVLDARDPFLILVDRENTEQLLAEQRRQMSGAYDERQIAAAGKLLGARYVLAVRLLRFDDVLTRQLEAQVQLISAETGRIQLSEVVQVNRQEIGRGAPRAQLLERASKRIAQRLVDAGARL